MNLIFGILSTLAIIAGLFSVTNVTGGVFCAILACWLAIMIRISDAAKQHKEAMASNERLIEVLSSMKQSKDING